MSYTVLGQGRNNSGGKSLNCAELIRNLEELRFFKNAHKSSSN